jgi:hypothetical protein
VRDPTKALKRSPELIASNIEAIHQIKFELGRNNLSDIVVLAIIIISKYPDLIDLEMKERIELNSTSPSGLPSIPSP